MTPALERAQALIDLGRWEAARTVLATTVAAEPAEPRAWCLLAQTCLGVKDHGAALDAAGRAAALDPDPQWPHRLRSITLTAQGRHDEAVVAAKEAVRCEPNSWQTHYILAGALLGQWAELLRQAPVRERMRPGVHHAALAAAARAVELRPNEARPHLRLAQVHGAARHRGRMHAAAARARALAPDDADVLNDLAVLEHNRGDRVGGLVGLLRASALQPCGPGAANYRLLSHQYARRANFLTLAVLAWTARLSGAFAAGTTGGGLRVTCVVGLAAVLGLAIAPMTRLITALPARQRRTVFGERAGIWRLVGLSHRRHLFRRVLHRCAADPRCSVRVVLGRAGRLRRGGRHRIHRRC